MQGGLAFGGDLKLDDVQPRDHLKVAQIARRDCEAELQSCRGDQQIFESDDHSLGGPVSLDSACEFSGLYRDRSRINSSTNDCRRCRRSFVPAR